MRIKERKYIIILFVSLALIVGLVFFVLKVKPVQDKVNENKQQAAAQAGEGGATSADGLTVTANDGTVENVSGSLKDEKTFEGYKISNISLIKKTGQETLLVADVTNTTSEEKKGMLVNVVLLDKSGNEMGKIPASIVSTKPGETIELRAEITEDYVNAYNFTLERKNK